MSTESAGYRQTLEQIEALRVELNTPNLSLDDILPKVEEAFKEIEKLKASLAEMRLRIENL